MGVVRARRGLRAAGLRSGLRLALLAMAGCAAAGAAGAQESRLLNAYGMPGLIDMPSATVLPDAELSATFSTFAGQARQTLSFQITPRLTGSFRYAQIQKLLSFGNTQYDRSFDLHYLLTDEGRYLPGLALGIRDIIGTGVYSGEYLVASKALTPDLRLTGGIGWGRLGSHGSFDNPLSIFGSGFDTRPPGFENGETGGTPNLSQLFRGPAALFGGVSWQASDRITLLAEYSSDAYPRETASGNFIRRSPLNFGLRYAILPEMVIEADYMYGSQIGISAHLMLNPRLPPISDRSPAPIPVRPRAGTAQSWPVAWVSDSATVETARTTLTTLLRADGIVVASLTLSGQEATVRYANTRYIASPQAMGHIARAMSVLLPPSVESFHLEPQVEGMATVRVTLQRRDLEAFENAPDGSWSSLARARIDDPAGGPLPNVAAFAPRLSWGFGPYMSTALFDPQNPFRYDVGAQLTGRLDIMPGLSISGVVRQKAFGNKDESTRVSDSVLPHVRSDSNFYDKNNGVVLDRLTVDYFTRPGRSLYARLSFGYLEPMFGGVSAELLWKPVRGRLALGIEANYVKQRDFDKGFGFQDYAVASGHLSAYYDLGKGYAAQVDVGRFLAGDLGATLALDRTFNNGWKVGAYMTLTDVPFETFGEGAFDKGIRLTVPVAWSTGRPGRAAQKVVIQPILRDGGARLGIVNRLYDQVRGDQANALQDQWGTFWR